MRADQRGGVEGCQDCAFPSQTVDVWRFEGFRTEAAQVGVTLIVGEDENQVGSVLDLGTASEEKQQQPLQDELPGLANPHGNHSAVLLSSLCYDPVRRVFGSH